MTEVKKCIKALAVYYFLLGLSILPGVGIIPRSFPTDSTGSFYLLFLSVCLILRYYQRAAGRRALRTSVHSLAVMIMLMFLFRCLKYTVFGNVSAPGRYAWYFYYLPLLCIPLLLFYTALYTYAEDEGRVLRRWGWTLAITALLVLAVLTNDLHQQVFRFQPGFANWDGDYSYGPLFPIITAWQYLLYTAAVVILVARYPIRETRRRSWLVLVPFLFGITMIVCLMTGGMPRINGFKILEFSEILCFMAAGVVECCMQLGLIPVNEDFGKLIGVSSLPVRITDLSGRTLYRSAAADDSSFLSAADGTRIAEHTILHRLDLPNGYGFWQDDVTELDRLNRELEEANEALAEKNEFIRLQNELKVRQKTIEQRSLVYDEIAKRTYGQSLEISRLSRLGMSTEDRALKDKYRRHITLLGSYIKRYANLMILSSEHESISVGELVLSFSEVLHYLNLYGIPGDMLNTAAGEISATKALAAFEAFEGLLEGSLSDLTGVCVSCADKGGLTCKLVFENMLSGYPEAAEARLAEAGIGTAFEYEDNVGYLTLTLSEEGGRAG